MIPGISAVPQPRTAQRAAVTAIPNTAAKAEAAKPSQPETLTHLLLPHPIADPLTLYQLVIADLLLLGVTCGIQGRLLPSLSLPEPQLPIFAVLVTLFAFTEGIYRRTPDPFPEGTVPGLVRSVAFAMVLVFIAEKGATRFLAAPLTVATSLGSLLLYRQFRQFAWARRKQDEEPHRVLIVGSGPGARAIARGLHADNVNRTVVRGFLDDSAVKSPGVLGHIRDLDWLARAEFVDEVILALPGQPAVTRVAADIALRNHLDIRAVPDLPPGPWPDANVDYVGGVPLVALHREPIPSAGLFLKRLLDVAGAGLSLVFAAPVMALVALLIRLDSPGPVIYGAERTGAKGRRFRCYKFRSMVTNADHLKAELRARNQREGPIFKIVGDPRITRVGRFIRRYSLDELPQLWNVLRGDMSLVGPRPHPVDEVNHYELHHYRRLDVKPGITCLWQITARHSPSFDLNMHLDLTYIENWSLKLDMRILLGTIRVLFAPEGA
jgi:exopolysaccharide biosynthesis polyprenyl glycosylphosphotransferase